jgi:hypothetical protein
MASLLNPTDSKIGRIRHRETFEKGDHRSAPHAGSEYLAAFCSKLIQALICRQAVDWGLNVANVNHADRHGGISRYLPQRKNDAK